MKWFRHRWRQTVKIYCIIILPNEVHVICWQAFSMTAVAVLCTFFSKITFVSVLHKREWNRVRLLVKEKNMHKNTKSLGSMHFDRSGLHTLSHSSKHTIQNHTSPEKRWFAPCSFSFLMLFFLLRHGQPDSDGSPESVRWSRRGPWSKQPERFWNIYHPVDGYVDKVQTGM